MAHATPGSSSATPFPLLRWIATAALVGILVGLVAGVVAISTREAEPEGAIERHTAVVTTAGAYELRGGVRAWGGT